MVNRRLDNAKAAAQEFMQAFHPERKWWIVGGLLRDDLLRRPWKDIDIFINGFSTDLLPEDCDDPGASNAYLLRAYTVKDYPYKGELYEINLIFMRGHRWTLKSMTDRCDFGICQIGWCPETRSTYTSPLFELDRKRLQLTLCRETTVERVQRMQAKFPHWALRNPDRLELDGKRCWSYDPLDGRLKATNRKVKFNDIAKPVR